MNKDKATSTSHNLAENLCTDISTSVRTRSSLQNFCTFSSFLSLIELKNHLEVFDEPNLVIVMQDELGQFEKN